MKSNPIIKAILIFLLAGLFFISFSQSESTLESIAHLKSKCVSAPVGDKVSILNQIANKFLNTQADSSKKYAQNALELARIIKNRNAELKALVILAEANYELYQYTDAILCYEKALDISQTLKNDSLSSEIHYSLGSVFYATSDLDKAKDQIFQSIDLEQKLESPLKLAHRFYYLADIFQVSGEYDQALVYLIKALNVYEEELDIQNKADTYNSIGVVYYNLGSYEKALDYYLRSLNLFEDLDDKSGIASSLNNLGLVYYDWGNKEKALQYYQKSMQMEEVSGNLMGVAGSYNNIGIIYADWGQHEIAIDYYQKAMDIYTSAKNSQGVARVQNNIGESYLEMGEHSKALKFLLESLEVEKELGNKMGMAQSYHTIGNLYYKIGNLDQAIYYNRLSTDITDSGGLMSILQLNYELFYQIYLKKNDYQKALNYYQAYTEQKDTIYNRQFHNRLAEVQSRYEIDKLEKEREEALNDYHIKQDEVRTQRIYLVIIFILMIVFGILVYYDIQSKIKANKKLKAINDELHLQKEELTATIGKYKKSESKFKNLVENSPTGIIHVNNKGKILQLNKRILEILGSPDEDSMKEINCLEYEPLKQVGLSDAILKSIKTGKMIHKENYYKTKWGKDIYLNYYIAPIKNKRDRVTSLIINVEDITRSKVAERSKRLTDIKYRILVENSLQAMLVIQDGELIFANSRLKELSQYSFNELTKSERNWLEILLHPDDFDQAITNVKKALDGNRIPPRSEYRYIRKDGEVRWIETMGSMVEYNGKPAILLVAVDVTERKNAESILIASGEKLEHVNAMKDKFFSIIAHDLKNPFNTILGFSNLLYEAYDNFNEEQRKNFIKNICEASESTFKLLQNLLEWSRTQTGSIEYKPERLDLSSLIDENLQIIKSGAKTKGITVRSDVVEGTYAFADTNMIRAVIRNLLSNAVKFTNSGGVVSITSNQSDHSVDICISDSGVGLEPEDLNRLFRIDDQFKSLGTNNEQGSGLGLILCKEFVEKNNGKIWVESEAGVGSNFSFRLPVSDPAASTKE